MSEKEFIIPCNNSNMKNNSNDNNQNKTFSTLKNLVEKSDTKLPSPPPTSKKNILFIKKLNIKETKNNYFSSAIQNIFFTPKNYLDNIYEGKKIIIGKEIKKPIGIKQIYESYYRQNKRRKTITKNDIKSTLNSFQKIRNISFNKYLDSSRITVGDSTRSNKIKGVINKSPITDGELKIIFRKSAERAEENKEKNNKYFPYFFAKKNNNQVKNILNKTQGLNINKMLDLQEKILKIDSKNNKKNEKIIHKIIGKTKKQKNKILMNENNNNLLILNQKKADKESYKFNALNILHNNSVNDLMKNWIINLRKNKTEEIKSKMPPPKELIYYNKEFSNDNNNIYSSNIRNQFYKKINSNKFYEAMKKKNLDRKNKNNDSNNININSIRSLFIQGKNLLNHEIKLSKELIGKKKKLLEYSFRPNEISNILLAQSNSIENVTTPKAIFNSMEVHKLS